jgi:hypothetical protein
LHLENIKKKLDELFQADIIENGSQVGLPPD